MRWIEGSLAALLALTVVAQAEAQIIVVRAAGPSASLYKPGSIVPADKPLALRAGDVLTLLDDKGSWTLRGPGNVPPRTRQAPLPTQLAAVDSRRARIGAVRNPDGEPGMRPNLWLVDVRQGGPTCVLAATPPVLWRADATAPATMRITGPDKAVAAIEWVAGQTTHDWPQGLPIANGAYRIEGAAGTSATSLSLAAIAPPATVIAAAQALAARSCTAQLDLLAAQTATGPSS